MFRVYIKQNKRTWRYRVKTNDIETVRSTIPTHLVGRADTFVLVTQLDV